MNSDLVISWKKVEVEKLAEFLNSLGEILPEENVVSGKQWTPKVRAKKLSADLKSYLKKDWFKDHQVVVSRYWHETDKDLIELALDALWGGGVK